MKLTILDKSGASVRELTATKEKGFNRVQWDLRGRPLVSSRRAGGAEGAGQAGQAGGAGGGGAAGAADQAGGGGGFGGNAQGAIVDPGEYVARLTLNGKELTTPVIVEADPLVTMTTDDRGKRRAVITAALDLQAKSEPASVRAESASDQLEALSKSVDAVVSAPTAVKAATKDAAAQASKIKTELARVNRSVTQLLGQIGGSPFVPTETQRQELEDLQREYREQSDALNTLVTTTIPAVEKQLNDAGVPRIVIK